VAIPGVRNQGYSALSNQGCAAWVKRTRHPTRRSCKLSTSETYNQCNLYGTATRRTVAAQYSAGAVSLGRSVMTQRNRPTCGILLTLQPGRPVKSQKTTTRSTKVEEQPQHECTTQQIFYTPNFRVRIVFKL